jgi:hypothetical protein
MRLWEDVGTDKPEVDVMIQGYNTIDSEKGDSNCILANT